MDVGIGVDRYNSLNRLRTLLAYSGSNKPKGTAEFCETAVALTLLLMLMLALGELPIISGGDDAIEFVGGGDLNACPDGIEGRVILKMAPDRRGSSTTGLPDMNSYQVGITAA